VGSLTTFLGSANSRYYAGASGQRMFLAKEECTLWEREIPFDVFQLLAVGTYGSVFLRGPQGIYVYELQGAEPSGPLQRWSREELAATSSQLGAVKVAADGRSLCVERMTLQTRLSEKIFEFLSSTTVEPHTTIHEIIFHDLVDDTTKFFYRAMSSVKNPQKFLWDISPDFEWIVMGEPQSKNNTMRFAVAHVPTQTIYHEFLIPQLRVHALRVGRGGTAVVDVSQGSERGIVVVTREGQRSTLTPPTEYTLAHVGPGWVALKTSPTPFLIVKGFDDQLIVHADLRPLERLEVDYDVHFNERDDIDIVSLTDIGVRVVHSNVHDLEIDARRWEIVADTQAEMVASAAAARTAVPEPSRRPQRLFIEHENGGNGTIQPMMGVDGLTSGVAAAPPPPLPRLQRLNPPSRASPCRSTSASAWKNCWTCWRSASSWVRSASRPTWSCARNTATA
jgi:hypothetical protein